MYFNKSRGFINKHIWLETTKTGFCKTSCCSVKKLFFIIVVLNEIWTPSLLFLHRFRSGHFRIPLSNSNAVSSTRPHKKKKRTTKKLLDSLGLLGYCFFYISLLQLKFHILSFLQYHIYFSWVIKEKTERRKITEQKNTSDFKTTLAWFFFKPPTSDPSIHRSFIFLKIRCHSRSLEQNDAGCNKMAFASTHVRQKPK